MKALGIARIRLARKACKQFVYFFAIFCCALGPCFKGVARRFCNSTKRARECDTQFYLALKGLRVVFAKMMPRAPAVVFFVLGMF